MSDPTPTFSDRLKRWRESEGLTQSDLAARVDVSLSTIQRWERGDLPKGAELLALDALGFDPTWALTGRETGQKSDGDAVPALLQGGGSSAGETVAIPHYAVQLSAGNGRPAADFEDLERLVLPAAWVRRVFGRPAAHLVLAGAAGTSMEPTIRDRDLLVVDTSDQRLTSGRIYALVVGDNLLVKRIERTLRGQIFLRPDNSAYQTEELTSDLADTVRILGQVIWHGGSLE